MFTHMSGGSPTYQIIHRAQHLADASHSHNFQFAITEPGGSPTRVTGWSNTAEAAQWADHTFQVRTTSAPLVTTLFTDPRWRSAFAHMIFGLRMAYHHRVAPQFAQSFVE